MDIDEAIDALLGRPIKVDTARAVLPATGGIYAWWTERGAIPGVPENPHPKDENLSLFYVGRAPRDSASSATLQSRIVKNHLSGNTGASTFRFTLAALLMETLGFSPRRTATKYVLPASQNQALSDWLRAHLRLTWVEHEEPWTVEDQIIARLRPPLNLAGNASHPFNARLSEARARFREAASRDQES